jgi:hypothetical protein
LTSVKAATLFESLNVETRRVWPLYAYDSTWALAFAIDAAIQAGDDLANATKLLSHLHGVAFSGASGAVKFDSNLDGAGDYEVVYMAGRETGDESAVSIVGYWTSSTGVHSLQLENVKLRCVPSDTHYLVVMVGMLIVWVFFLIAVTIVVVRRLRKSAGKLEEQCFHVEGSGYYMPAHIISTAANGDHHVVRAHEYHRTSCSLKFTKGREVVLKFMAKEEGFQSELACRGIDDSFRGKDCHAFKPHTEPKKRRFVVQVIECLRLATTTASKAYGDIGSVAIGEGAGATASKVELEPEPKPKPEPAALTDAEIRDKDEYMRNHWIVSETSKGRVFWDVLQVVLILYVAIAVPYRIWNSIDPRPWEFTFVVDVFVDIFFILDIALNFNTAVVHKGDLKYKRADIASESNDPDSIPSIPTVCSQRLTEQFRQQGFTSRAGSRSMCSVACRSTTSCSPWIHLQVSLIRLPPSDIDSLRMLPCCKLVCEQVPNLIRTSLSAPIRCSALCAS